MEKHPIPQDVTGFQFKLIGDMTVKQFAYIAAGVVMAVIFYYAPFHILIKIVCIPIFALTGFALAFLPIAGRPLDAMVVYFVKALINPNQYMYHKSGSDAFAFLIAFTQRTLATVAASHPQQADLLKQYLSNVSESSKNPLDEKEANRLSSLFSTFPAQGLQPLPLAQTSQQSTPTQALKAQPVIQQTPRLVQPIVPPAAKPQPPQETVVKPPQPLPQIKPIPLPQAVKSQSPVKSAQPKPTDASVQKAPPLVLSALPKQPLQTTPPPKQIDHLAQPSSQPQQKEQITSAPVQPPQSQVPTGAWQSDQSLALQKQLELLMQQKKQLEQQVAILAQNLNIQKPQSSPSGNAPLQKGQTPNVREIPKELGAKIGFPITPDAPNVITGIVKDSRGNILPNILVEVKDKEGNAVRAFKTNSLGQFASATALLEGVYRVEFEDPSGIHKFDAIQLAAKGEVILPLEVISTDAREELRRQLFGT